MNDLPINVTSYRQRAIRVLRSPRLLTSLSGSVSRRLRAEGSLGAALDSARSDLAASLALLNAWRSGRYRGIATHSILLVVAGLVYLVTPTDAVPDLLPGVGFLDDATVLSFVFGQVGHELCRFREWQDSGAETGEV